MVTMYEHNLESKDNSWKPKQICLVYLSGTSLITMNHLSTDERIRYWLPGNKIVIVCLPTTTYRSTWCP
jgi:hypothetical protein